MASSSAESMQVVAGTTEAANVQTYAQPTTEQPLKLKGRARLAASLQRIASSQSLAKAGRTRARTYSGTGKGSISCISLNSTSSGQGASFGTSLNSQSSNGFSTAPTSTVTTPGAHIPSWDERARFRSLSNLSEKNSAALPAGYTVSTRPGTATPGIAEVDEDYFSRTVAKQPQPRKKFNFWLDMPSEIKMQIFTYLEPRQIVR